ncbi:MAG: DNA polymerase III subunit delta' [Paracoccaceae bacterium]
MSREADDALAPDREPGCPHPSAAPRLLGQARAEAAFLSAWGAGRLAQAWLLTGPRGVGKATLAYRAARALIAEAQAPASLEPPEGCPVMRRIRAGSEARLRVLRRAPDPAERKPTRVRTVIDAAQAREISTFLAHAAPDGGRRAVIVDAVDDCSVQAANALLKVVEEPPADTVFLLVCQRPGGLLPTIRSRCRPLALAPLGPADLAAAAEASGNPVENAGGLAELAAGSVGLAVALASSGGLALYEQLCGLLSADLAVDRRRLLALAGSLGGRANETRYARALELGPILLTRLARAAVGDAPPPACRAEARLMRALDGRPRLGPALAEAAAAMQARGAHARGVNLDPARTVIDSWADAGARLAVPAAAP